MKSVGLTWLVHRTDIALEDGADFLYGLVHLVEYAGQRTGAIVLDKHIAERGNGGHRDALLGRADLESLEVVLLELDERGAGGLDLSLHIRDRLVAADFGEQRGVLRE